MHLALIGCGLMGGSFALAAQQAGIITRVTGYSIPYSSAQHFFELGVIQHIAQSAAEAVAMADVVLLATPVASLPQLLAEVASALKPQTLVMDVSSTKRSVQQAATHTLADKAHFFVPAHPIAGKEQAGHADPRADLYHNKTVILCPNEQTHPTALKQAHELWQHVGAHTQELSALDHDRGLAAVSHLPHFLAFAYMDALLAQADHTELLALGGPGFRDFSRIAGCEASIWKDILIDNQDQILPLLQAVRQSIQDLEVLITKNQPEKLASVLNQASQARINWP